MTPSSAHSTVQPASSRMAVAISAFLQYCCEHSSNVRNEFLENVTKFKTTIYDQGTDRMLDLIYDSVINGRDKTLEDYAVSDDRLNVIMKKGSIQFGIKWGNGDSKGAEMYLHGDGGAPISRNYENPFEGYSSDADLIVVQAGNYDGSGSLCRGWEKDAPELYEVLRPFISGGYDVGINGFSSCGYGACELSEYVMGVKGNNTEPLREGQQITTRFFDGVPNKENGKTGADRIGAMLGANGDNYHAEFYWSNAGSHNIDDRTRDAGQLLEQQYADQVQTQGYQFKSESNNHRGHTYGRHGYMQFVVPDHIPGVTKD